MDVIARQVLYLEIDALERDMELQARVSLNADVVKDYADQMAAGAVFPPVLVFARPGAHALVDGFHRVAAREALGFTTVLAEIRQGTREDALWHGLTANQTHGLRRTNDDKHRCVVKALTHARGRTLSDRQIASHCGVHHYTVSRIRQQLEQRQMIEVQGTRVVTRGGVSYEQRLHKKRAIPSPPHQGPALILPQQSQNDAEAHVTVKSDETPAPRLASRLERVSERPDAPAGNARVRRLIQQAHGKLKEALEELSREPCAEDLKRKRLFLHLTHLRSELSSAEERLLEDWQQPKNGTQAY